MNGPSCGSVDFCDVTLDVGGCDDLPVLPDELGEEAHVAHEEGEALEPNHLELRYTVDTKSKFNRWN